MRILHVSDTHGTMPELRGEYDVCVHSGDFCPNKSFGIRAIEETFQPYWLEDNAKRLKAWLGDKPVLVCSGNHDFVPVVRWLRKAGVDAHSLDDNHVEMLGVKFYGFPWTNPFYDWNWMASSKERRARLAPAVELMDLGEIDVFVSHGPMQGVLDRTASGERVGSRVLRLAMQDARHPPKLFLHGHIHESAGVQDWSRGMLVSNAATTQRILEVNPS